MEPTGDNGNGSAGVLGVGRFGSYAKDGEARRLRSWFTRMVTAYLRYHYAKRSKSPVKVKPGLSEKVRAEQCIRSACLRTAATGASAGMLTTGATLFTAESGGATAFLAVPAGALAIGGEMLYRSLIHIEMTCDLADIFGVKFNPDDPTEFWQLYSLAFGHQKHEDAEDPGKELIDRVTEEESKEVGEKLGSKLLGESVLRNALPFIGIVASSVQNWKMTKRVGETVRRYVRYQRALGDALSGDLAACKVSMDLLIEGLWFIFTADGRLSPEEAAVLANFIKKCDPEVRKHLSERFTDDEADWLIRLPTMPEGERDAFLHALQVAAAVDKSVSLPEQKILSRAAHVLSRKFDITVVNEMMREFEDKGVLGHGAAAAPGNNGHTHP